VSNIHAPEATGWCADRRPIRGYCHRNYCCVRLRTSTPLRPPRQRLRSYGALVLYFSDSLFGAGLSFRQKSSFRVADHTETIPPAQLQNRPLRWPAMEMTRYRPPSDVSEAGDYSRGFGQKSWTCVLGQHIVSLQEYRPATSGAPRAWCGTRRSRWPDSRRWRGTSSWRTTPRRRWSKVCFPLPRGRR
jgi:hypothetical protein